MNRLSYFLISALLFSMTMYMFYFSMQMTDLETIGNMIKVIFLPCILGLLSMLSLLLSIYLFNRGVNHGKPKKHVRFR